MKTRTKLKSYDGTRTRDAIIVNAYDHHKMVERLAFLEKSIKEPPKKSLQDSVSYFLREVAKRIRGQNLFTGDRVANQLEIMADEAPRVMWQDRQYPRKNLYEAPTT